MTFSQLFQILCQLFPTLFDNFRRFKMTFLLKRADLTACVRKNHIFLCEGHLVLNTDLEGRA